jgi:hypothetical protein
MKRTFFMMCMNKKTPPPIKCATPLPKKLTPVEGRDHPQDVIMVVVAVVVGLVAAQDLDHATSVGVHGEVPGEACRVP